MTKNSQLPPILLARATGLRLRGRVHFLKDCIGEVQHSKDEDYEVFRKVILDRSKDQPEKKKHQFKKLDSSKIPNLFKNIQKKD